MRIIVLENRYYCGESPIPAVRTWPMRTSETLSGDTCALLRDSVMTIAPRSCAERELRAPLSVPIGVLTALSMTMSSAISKVYAWRLRNDRRRLVNRLPIITMLVMQEFTRVY